SPGLTLGWSARILEALDCERALNLDGGSSKRMVVGDEQVDRSSTDFIQKPSQPPRLRPIHSAIVIGSEIDVGESRSLESRDGSFG
ncbi:MAG: phosphodiester glycosidase family protein, partial [Myxococcota bacterium]|nr:phosphodiester glycosidase family protein [Myxococcota bacterium]